MFIFVVGSKIYYHLHIYCERGSLSIDEMHQIYSQYKWDQNFLNLPKENIETLNHLYRIRIVNSDGGSTHSHAILLRAKTVHTFTHMYAIHCERMDIERKNATMR